jgi:hypothetical protein
MTTKSSQYLNMSKNSQLYTASFSPLDPKPVLSGVRYKEGLRYQNGDVAKSWEYIRTWQI